MFILCYAKSNRIFRWKTLGLTFIINRVFKGICLIFLLFGCSGCFPNCKGGGVKLKITASLLDPHIRRLNCCAYVWMKRMCFSGGRKKERKKERDRQKDTGGEGGSIAGAWVLLHFFICGFPFKCFNKNCANDWVTKKLVRLQVLVCVVCGTICPLKTAAKKSFYRLEIL